MPFLFSNKDMHLLGKIDVKLVLSYCSCVHSYMAVHFIIIFHLLCMHDSYTMHMHAIGVSERVTLLEFEQGLPEEQRQAQETEVQAPEEGPTKKFLSVPITNLHLF